MSIDYWRQTHTSRPLQNYNLIYPFPIFVIWDEAPTTVGWCSVLMMNWWSFCCYCTTSSCGGCWWCREWCWGWWWWLYHLTRSSNPHIVYAELAACGNHHAPVVCFSCLGELLSVVNDKGSRNKSSSKEVSSEILKWQICLFLKTKKALSLQLKVYNSGLRITWQEHSKKKRACLQNKEKCDGSS